MSSFMVYPILSVIFVLALFPRAAPEAYLISDVSANLASRSTSTALENSPYPAASTLEYSLSTLQLKALGKWLQIRQTRTKDFQFMTQALDLKAYMLTCPQQDQDWPQDTSAIDAYIDQFLRSIIPILYEEELDYLQTLTAEGRSAIFKNTAKTIYDFDLGQKVANSPYLNAAIDHTQRVLCRQKAKEIKDLFIHLNYQLKSMNSIK